MTAVNSNSATKKTINDANASLDHIKRDFKVLKDDVIVLSQTVKSESMKKIEEATIELSEKIDSLKKEGNQELDRVNDYISDKPAQSVAIAFGVGALFAALFLNRR